MSTLLQNPADLDKAAQNILLAEVDTRFTTEQQPTVSQRTSLMVCTGKPGKEKSLKVKDKRRLSLLNADFKIITGVEVG